MPACAFADPFDRRVGRHRRSVTLAGATFAIACLLGPLGAQQPAGRPAASSPATAAAPVPLGARPLVLRVDGQERASVRRDIVYKTVDTVTLRADVYLPAAIRPGERVPVVLYSSGGSFGAFGARETTVYRQYGELAAAHGLAGVTFDKRSRPGAQGLTDATQDIDDLIAFLRRNADTLRIDPDRICLWGFSAGGRYVYAALRDTEPRFRCVVAYYGMGGYELLRQVTALGDRIPPILVARAGLDDFNMAIDLFVHEAVNRNVRIELHNYPDGRHAFDVLDDTDRSRDIMRRTFAFMREQLR